MPGAADDGDAFEAVLDGGADRAAHVGFARRFVGVAVLGGERGAGGGHGVADGVEEAERVVFGVLFFDDASPPRFAVGIAGGVGECVERIGAGRGGRRRFG